MPRCPTCGLDPDNIELAIEALETVLEGRNETIISYHIPGCPYPVDACSCPKSARRDN